MTSLAHQIDLAVEMLSSAQYAVALTGAGISTPSGIPDFRTPSHGLWEQIDPMAVATLTGFWSNPAGFYQWMRPLARVITDALPNAAHRALADLEMMGRLSAIITQNIDLLHSRAGSTTVHEVHGHLRDLSCTHCFRIYPADQRLRRFIDEGDIPYCPHCGGVLKPNVILFGEQLPARTVLAAKQALRRTDLLIVIGSSLEVFPVADFPRLAQQVGARVILVNLGPTYFDAQADLVIHADVVETLPAIVTALQADA